MPMTETAANTGPDRERRLRRHIVLAALGLAALIAVGLWRTGPERPGRRLIVLSIEPENVMGTSCRLVAVTPPGSEALAREALSAAEAALRQVESRMSSWLETSEIGRLNRAGAGEEIPLSPSTRTVLTAARDLWRTTAGAFDVTLRPLIELWREAGETDRTPGPEAVAAARAASHWDLIEILQTSVRKADRSVQVDLGGIAKGYGIDRAIEAMQGTGAIGGMVDVGGDLRLWGTSPQAGLWPVEVRDPFGGPEPVERFDLAAGAVCTSGDYARYTVIEGRRFSHIIDPRTGRPAADAASVTVIGPDAMTADSWATALSVLGAGGLELVPADLEVILITSGGVTHRR